MSDREILPPRLVSNPPQYDDTPAVTEAAADANSCVFYIIPDHLADEELDAIFCRQLDENDVLESISNDSEFDEEYSEKREDDVEEDDGIDEIKANDPVFNTEELYQDDCDCDSDK